MLRQIEELSASRTRLASTSDAELRDIERALHEGVQQDLVGLAANLEVAVSLLETDPAAAKELLDELQREARRALAEVRELATRIFPPLLEAGGLVPELRAAASRADTPVRLAVELDGTVPSAHAAAVYFCALDVFERVPAGTPVVVRIRHAEDALAFEVVAEYDLGSDRNASHDRVEALGGTLTITSERDRTTVAGSLPVQ